MYESENTDPSDFEDSTGPTGPTGPTEQPSHSDELVYGGKPQEPYAVLRIIVGKRFYLSARNVPAAVVGAILVLWIVAGWTDMFVGIAGSVSILIFFIMWVFSGPRRPRRFRR
jgi:hypothetical protein